MAVTAGGEFQAGDKVAAFMGGMGRRAGGQREGSRFRDRYHALDVIWTMNQAGADPSGPIPRAAVDIVCLALLPDDDPTDSLS